jgi:chromosomal replication initiation ATPase DnaA
LPSVTSALDDLLATVKQRVRARFGSGRVLAVEGTTITFGTTNAIHRDRCNEVKDEIESAFSNHFGHPVTLEIVVDDDAPSPNMDPAKIETRPTVEITADEDVGPVEELQNATDQSANGLERLTKAFPGSTVVEPDPNQEKP